MPWGLSSPEFRGTDGPRVPGNAHIHDGDRLQMSGAAGHGFSARPGEPEHVTENVALVANSEEKLGIQ